MMYSRWEGWMLLLFISSAGAYAVVSGLSWWMYHAVAYKQQSWRRCVGRVAVVRMSCCAVYCAAIWLGLSVRLSSTLTMLLCPRVRVSAGSMGMLLCLLL